MAVIPVKTGIQKWLISLDSRVRGNDENGSFLTFYETITLRLRIRNLPVKVLYRNRKIVSA